MLETIFGKSPIVKVLDFFLQHADYDYTKNEIMKYSDISRGTFYSEDVLGVLTTLNLITKTREVGNSALYKLNMENPIVKKLDQLDHEISIATVIELAKAEIGEVAFDFQCRPENIDNLHWFSNFIATKLREQSSWQSDFTVCSGQPYGGKKIHKKDQPTFQKVGV